MSEPSPAAVISAHVSTQPYRPPFLQSPGRPPVPWQRWLAMFEDWLLAIGFPETEAVAPRKAAILRASLGTEGFRIYASLATNPRESYADAVARLETHFGQPASTIFNRAQFSRRQQRSGESVTQYVAALREMASKCEFAADQLDERVRDQFVAWACCDRIRERLLQEPATRKLDELVSLAITIERAMSAAPALSSNNLQPSASVGYVFSRRHARLPLPSSAPSGCANCGRDGHTARSADCPARTQTCHNCLKPGHYSIKCRSNAPADHAFRRSGQADNRRRSKSSHRRRNHRSARTNKIDDDIEAAADFVNSVTISSVQVCKPGAFKQVRCHLADVPVDFLLDLGAKVSIVSRAKFESSLQRYSRLQPSDVTLRTYNGQPIACLGRISLPVSLGGAYLSTFTFYVTAKGESVMGVDLFDALGGAVRLGEIDLVSHPIDVVTSSTSTSVSTVSLAHYPTLTSGLGRLKGFVHRPHIDPSVRPVQQKFYHQPLALRQPISDEIRRMERDGIIERIDASVWTSNIVVARKKNGEVRVCVNLSDVNKALVPQRYPLPTMEELTERIAGSTVFSKLDLVWGYLQLELAEECRYITAFVSHEGVFRFRSLPFGLATGPSAFQQVIRHILEGLPGCVNILDDLLIYGRDSAEHDSRLRSVLDRLAEYGATLHAEKCVLSQPVVDFNGHRVSAEGVRPLQSNVEALQRIPTPSNQRQLSRFIGVATYYAKFVNGFAALCQPFRLLLKPDSEWAWSADCQRAFEMIKQKIASPPTLRHFDVAAEETLVSCDASATALGACLSQKVGGVERPVAFASRVLSPAESKYSASEREALACMWACERWHFYLYGRRFTLVTDHQALKTLLTAGGSGHRPLRLHRWSDRLFQYTFDVVFRPGRDNHVADCLSRSFDDVNTELPIATPTTTEATSDDNVSDVEADDRIVSTIFGSIGIAVVTLSAVGQATTADDQLSRVRLYIINGWPVDKRAVPADLRLFYTVRDELSTAVEGLCVVRGCRTVIPSTLRAAVLELAHEGHPGIVRMKQRCRAAVWWPAIDTDVEAFVRDCTACIVSGKSVRPVPGPLQPAPLPSGPWRKLALDFAGEFVVAPAHQRYLLVAMDYYSKWPEVALCGSATSATVIEFLTGMFDRFGLVDEVVTDNGVQFTSSEFAEFLRTLGIRHSRTALYSPQANAEAERFNRVLKEGIRAAMAEGKSFHTGVRQTLAAYRMTSHTTTGVSPASLMFAFTARTPLSLLQPVRSPSLLTTQPSQSQAVARRVRFQQDKSAVAYDQRHRATATPIVVGDYVRIQLPRRSHKLAPKYSELHEVVKVNGNCVVLRNGQRWNLRRCLRHKTSLRSSSADRAQPGEQPSPQLSPTQPDSELEDGAEFTFTTLPPAVLPSVAAAAVADQTIQQRPETADRPAVRRSDRICRSRDFGPFVKY